MSDVDWETWLIEEAGNSVIEKKAELGDASLLPIEKLVYCLWVADYGVRNAGDLGAARDVYANFKKEGVELAKQLNLPQALSLFQLSNKEFEGTYDDHFDAVCREIDDIFAKRHLV